MRLFVAAVALRTCVWLFLLWCGAITVRLLRAGDVGRICLRNGSLTRGKTKAMIFKVPRRLLFFHSCILPVLRRRFSSVATSGLGVTVNS